MGQEVRLKYTVPIVRELRVLGIARSKRQSWVGFGAMPISSNH
ncbi:hypothetical protein [Sphingobacterium wenxiniae]|nr:hypothetical protein [Sphingobacterium wenxiniae]